MNISILMGRADAVASRRYRRWLVRAEAGRRAADELLSAVQAGNLAAATAAAARVADINRRRARIRPPYLESGRI